jgi:hypothetical protein
MAFGLVGCAAVEAPADALRRRSSDEVAEVARLSAPAHGPQPQLAGTVTGVTAAGDCFSVLADRDFGSSLAPLQQLHVVTPSLRLLGIALVEEVADGRARCRLLEPSPWPRVVASGDFVALRSGWVPTVALRGTVLEYRAAEQVIVTDLPAETLGISWRRGRWVFDVTDHEAYLGNAAACGEEGARLLLRIVVPVEDRRLPRPGDRVSTSFE